MSSISSNLNRFNSLNKLDANKDSKVTFQELKEVAKKDGNANDLSVKDLESVGITDKTLQTEIIKSFNDNSKVKSIDPNKMLFNLNKTKEVAANNIFKDISKDNTGLRKSICEVLDGNGDFKDNCITYKELKGLTQDQKDSIMSKAKSRGVKEEDVKAFFTAVESIKANPPKDDTKLIKWQNVMYDVKDPENDIKAAVKNKTVDQMKTDLLKKTGNSDLVKFTLINIDKLPNDDMKKEAIHYVSKLFDKHPSKANDILKSLYMYSSSNTPTGALVNNSKKMEFVKDILHDIAYPTDIDQKSKGTCAAAAIQVKLAISDPKKYVEIASKLADNKSWNGIQPNKTFEGDTNDSRSLSCKVIQNAFMDYANGGSSGDWDSKYSGDAAQGIVVDATNKSKGRGLYGNETEKLEENLFGTSDIDHITSVGSYFVSNDEILTEIDKGLKNNPVCFSVGGHDMLVLSKNSDNTYNIFTWGTERKIKAEDLEHFITGARVIDDTVWNSY